MTEGWNIALLGATGSVGESILAALSEATFPLGEVWLLASERSAGKSVRFAGRSLRVTDAAQFDWSQAHLAFFVAGREASERYAEAAAEAGCLVIDSSGAFALEPDVPLIVPDVNPAALADYRNRNIISIADSLTSQLLTAVAPLAEAGLRALNVTSLLAVSAQGRQAVETLAGESARLLNGLPAEPGERGHQVAFNVAPLPMDDAGIVALEQRLVEETRKILHDDALILTASCVQSPVFYGHAQIVQLETDTPLTPEDAYAYWAAYDMITVAQDGGFPTPVAMAGEAVRLSIGSVRNDYGSPSTLKFWSVADNVRFGGAWMAVRTAQRWIEEYSG